jgi:hypothetical protein
MRRETVVNHGFDPTFRSGEDIEIRWRLRRAGLRLGVSRNTIVEHRFAEDSFAFARAQFQADGYGLGLMVGKYRARGLHLVALPLAGGTRGSLLSLATRQWQWIPYYAAYTVFNYSAMVRALI